MLDADIIDQNIDRTEFAANLADHILDGLRLHHIGA